MPKLPRVCYFGIYDPTYSRNEILISGLRENGIEVIECRTDKVGLLKYFDLVIKHWKVRRLYDVMAVGFPGFQVMILARFLSCKPIIFDAFVSLYDSTVLDRKQFPANSLQAKYYWWLDKISMSMANVVLFDTLEHIKYVAEEFLIKREKCKRIFVGARTDIFFPEAEMDHKKQSSPFNVSFYGSYIPLQGISYIMKAAKLLEKYDIVFNMIGDGQEKANILALVKGLKLKNVVFSGRLAPEILRKKMNQADLCLWIFGDTEKTLRVIPNKVYECVAMKKTVLTGDTSAIRELFNDDELLLVKSADAESIAAGILRARNDPKYASVVALKGYNKLINTGTSSILGKELVDIIQECYKIDR